MPNGLRSKKSSGAALGMLQVGAQIGQSLLLQDQREQMQTQREQAALEKENERYAMQLRNNLLVKASEYQHEAEKTASMDAKKWNEYYWDKTTGTYLASLKTGHPNQPHEWLKPENSWKITQGSREKATAYLSDVGNIESEIALRRPTDFNTFSDPSNFLRKPVNNLWNPEYSEDYKRELAAKGDKSSSTNPLDTEYKQLRNAKLKNSLNAPAPADKDAIKGFVKTRQQYLGAMGSYFTTGQQMRTYYDKYSNGGKNPAWASEAVDKETSTVVGEDGKAVKQVTNLFNQHTKHKNVAGEKFAEFFGYLRDPDATSGALGIGREEAEDVVDFVDRWGKEFNGLQSPDDVATFANWIGARANGKETFTDPMRSKALKAPKFFNDAEKKAAARTYELLINKPLYQ
jgi:hypothetical protein